MGGCPECASNFCTPFLMGDRRGLGWEAILGTLSILVAVQASPSGLPGSHICLGPARTFQNQQRERPPLGLWSTQLFWVNLDRTPVHPQLHRRGNRGLGFAKHTPWLPLLPLARAGLGGRPAWTLGEGGRRGSGAVWAFGPLVACHPLPGAVTFPASLTQSRKGAMTPLLPSSPHPHLEGGHPTGWLRGAMLTWRPLRDRAIQGRWRLPQKGGRRKGKKRSF